MTTGVQSCYMLLHTHIKQRGRLQSRMALGMNHHSCYYTRNKTPPFTQRASYTVLARACKPAIEQEMRELAKRTHARTHALKITHTNHIHAASAHL